MPNIVKSVENKSVIKKTISRMSAKERKVKIINAVLSLADKDGPDRLSTSAIAKAAGLTHAGIFKHFPTKQDIWIAVAHEIAFRAKNYWQKPLDLTLLPREKIKALVSSHFKFLEDTPAILSILFSYELQHSNVELREVFTDLMPQFRNHLIKEFVLAKFNENEAKDLALLLVALMQGLAMRWVISQRMFNLQKEGTRLVEIQLNMIDFK